MTASDVLLVWALGYASAVLVFHTLLRRPVPVQAERPSSLPLVRSSSGVSYVCEATKEQR